MSFPVRPVRPAVVLAVLLALLAVLSAAVGVRPASAADDDGPRGPGVVQGVVRDGDGVPVPGATVEIGATRRPSDGSGSWTGGTRTTATDADGRYRLDGVAIPSEDVSVGYLVASADGYATTYDEGVPGRLMASPGVPARSDPVIRRRDATLRGRVSVRGGTADGAWVSAVRAGTTAGQETERFSTSVDDRGRWRLDVPAGRYRVQAGSGAGLPTWWPDVSASRPASLTSAVAAGGVLDDLDLSLRLRQPGPAVDEFGTWHHGADPGRAGDDVGRYPRDPYRSVQAVRGPQLRLGTPRSVYSFDLPKLPAGDLITVTGSGSAMALAVEVPVTNTGDDLLWIDEPRLEGAIAADSRCVWPGVSECGVPRPLEPGETRTLRVEPNSTAWAPEYLLTLVVPSTADLLDARVPLRLRNVGQEAFGRDDHRNLGGVWEYLSDEDQAMTGHFVGKGPPPSPGFAAWAAAVAAATAPRPPAPPAPKVPRRPAIGVVTVGRTSVRFTFPAAGRVDVRIDRLVRSKDRRRPDRWTRARAVVLRSSRAGLRTARIRRLALGPYRVRIVARIGGRTHRVTDYRDVKP